MSDSKIAVIGLGYVGLPLAIHLSEHFEIIGYDISAKRVEELSNGYDRTLECELPEIPTSENLKFTSNCLEIKSASVYVITVPTPVSPDKKPDLEPLLKASTMVGEALDRGDLVIYESTVFPGATENYCVPVLESASGLMFNQDFSCGYSPERINPGDKLRTLKNITKITSGSNKVAAERVDKLYSKIIDAGTWRAPSIRVAEAAKVIENAQRDVNIAFMNEISKIFNNLGIDTAEVLDAAGSKWNFLPFRPGLVGGHCISVDPYYLADVAQKNGCEPTLVLGARKINDAVPEFVSSEIKKRLVLRRGELAGAKVGILGVTFKEDCPDLRNSKVFDLIDALRVDDIHVYVSDPYADNNEVFEASSLQLTRIDFLRNLDAVIVSVSHNEYRQLSVEELKSMLKSNSLILADLKSIFAKEKFIEHGFDVFRL